jgi:hypothetical protein
MAQARPAPLFVLPLALALAGCMGPPQAIDRDPNPGLWIKGDVARVAEGKVRNWMFLLQDPADILCAAGIGTLWDITSVGTMMIVDGRTFVKTTSKDTDYALGESAETMGTPFAFGIARGHDRLLERTQARLAPPETLQLFFERRAEGRAVLGLFLADDASGQCLKAPPTDDVPPASRPEKYLETVKLDGAPLLVFGLALRDTKAARDDEASSRILGSVLGVDLKEGEPDGKLRLYAVALRLDRMPRRWPGPADLDRTIEKARFDALVRLDPASTFKQATWRTYWIGHINPPPGRRYIDPETRESMTGGKTPYIPLPPAE